MVKKATRKTGKNKKPKKRRRVNFEYNAKGAKQVSVAGDFNKWSQTSHAMKKDDRGVWKKSLILLPGTYEYKFLVDGRWKNDPLNKDTCTNNYGTTNNRLKISLHS